MVLRVSFCKETEIPHFFCELAQTLKPACSDTLANNILLYVVTGLLGVIPLTGILFSYSRIISSIMGISSAVVSRKSFPPVGLTSQSLPCSLVYLTSGTVHPSRKSSVASVTYTVVAPMLNPFIYSLRNGDMKEALRLFSRGAYSR